MSPISRWPSLLLLLSVTLLSRSQAGSQVRAVRTPEGGLQPQAAADSEGAVHLIYFKGDPTAGNIFYVRQEAGGDTWSAPKRVNSEAGSAMAIGTIRGAQLALGQGRVHVSWNGHAPKGGTYMDAPMLYARLDSAAGAFEPERNLIHFARGLDGGGSIAADDRGGVFVFWHVPKPGNTNGEAGRAVYVTRSRDGGKTFAQETLASEEATGACGCCGMRAFADNQGRLFALFRSATEMVNRDEILLGGPVGGELKPLLRHPWKTSACPMSSASFTQVGTATVAAWESRDQVYFSRLSGLQPGEPISPAGPAKRKHPAVAGNAGGELLLVWTEGTSWGKGGSVAWQLYDSKGELAGPAGRADGLPAWSLATAVAKKDGSFLVIY